MKPFHKIRLFKINEQNNTYNNIDKITRPTRRTEKIALTKYKNNKRYVILGKYIARYVTITKDSSFKQYKKCTRTWT